MRHTRYTALALAFIMLLSTIASAQKKRRSVEPTELHGSPESVEKMYDFATAHGLPFYLTQTNVDSAVAHGKLVQLTGDSAYELTRGVGFSYSTIEAKRFVEAFAPQYAVACGAPLTVSSAVRPTNRQPHNANPHSVHPTGIAIDFRRPYRGPCLDWVRGALAELERRGIVEATEEHHPVHLHVAVLVAPGGRVLLPNLAAGLLAQGSGSQVQSTSQVVSNASGDVSLKAPATGPRTYIVRQGDTLWDIASKVGVSVEALTRANSTLKRKALKPGATLIVPSQRGS